MDKNTVTIQYAVEGFNDVEDQTDRFDIELPAHAKNINKVDDFISDIADDYYSDLIVSVTNKITGWMVYYNRNIAFIRALLNRAVKVWQWIDKAPPLVLLKGPKKRIRYLSRLDAQRLLNELPEHLAAMVEFSLHTGLRQANVTGLKWENVDIPNRMLIVNPEDFKNGQVHSVPLNQTAISVLLDQRGKHKEYVFVYDGGPVTQANTKAFRKALKRANIQDFRWHDLRYTWASWLIQAGVSIEALQELGGWESREMVMRYAHLSRRHLTDSINLLDSICKSPTVEIEQRKIG